ncbi:hypothetical protein D3C71_2102020 [compost metagenome]
MNGRVITYIDYDLDVIRMPAGDVHVVDREEYERHKLAYHYSAVVESKVEQGLQHLLERVKGAGAPFRDELVLSYYEQWRERGAEG